MMSLQGWLFGAVCLWSSLVLIGTGGARADDVSDFYKLKTVQIVVGYGPGGGNDVYARLLARHIGKYIPGQPNVIVQNMPGAGSLRAANYLYSVAPKDGTTFGTFARTLPLAGVLGGSSPIQFDPRKFVWLGSSSSYKNDAYILFVRPDAPVASIAAARAKGGPQLVLSGTAEGDTSADVPILLRETLGLNIKLVNGYPDSNALFLSVENKEVDGRVADLSSVRSSRPHWVDKGGMNTLLQYGRATRHPDFADVPTARELATSDDNRKLIEIMEISYALTRPYAAPPGIPAPRAKALEAAFLAVHKDAQYLEEADKAKLDISPIGGEEILSLIGQMAAMPDGLKERVKRLQGEIK
jgi:tripartite-type tricarboxylate transporter receptor subunit TctC